MYKGAFLQLGLIAALKSAQRTMEVRNMKKTLPVLVVYDDTPTRERAIQFCDHLIEKFWSQYEFDVSWWCAEALRREDTAKEASDKAAEASIVIFAIRPEGEIPSEIANWGERWRNQRGDHEGLLVGLMDPCDTASSFSTPRYAFLRELALRAGMDYLTEMPSTISHPIPDSLEAYSQRADQMTSVLDTILTRPQSRLAK